MARVRAGRLTWLLALLVSVEAATPLTAQTIPRTGVDSSSSTPAPSTSSSEALPIDLVRIRRGLATRKGILTLRRDIPVFRVEITEKMPPLESWLGDPKKLWRGPFTASPYHQEFLDMVTPPEARASFTNGELLQVLLTGLVGKLAARAVAGKLKSVQQANAELAACEEVRLTLLELNVQRQIVGLPPEPVKTCP